MSAARRTRPVAWLALALLAACGAATNEVAPPPPAFAPDAGQTPTGSPDAGAVDAGRADAGASDAGLLMQLQYPEAGRLYHGVFPAGIDQPDSDVSRTNLQAYEETVGRRVAWIYMDDEWLFSRAFPSATTSWIKAHGAVPFIRLMLRSQRKPAVTDPVFTLDRILAGEFDADLASWADAAKVYGAPLIVEYGTEINGDWNPWSAPYNGGLDIGPAKFQQAFRHIVLLMRARGAANITWALHYSGQNFPADDPRNVPEAYYPGDDVVDWVGISTYGSERPADHRCPSLRQLTDDMLPQLRAATAVKPLFLFEVGVTDYNPGCPSGPWVQAALTDLLAGRWPDIRGFAWWNDHWQNDANPADDSAMLVQENLPVADAFRAALTGPKAGVLVDTPLLK